MRKVLVSLPETDLQIIDAAAHREHSPLDDPAGRGSFSRLLRRAERRTPLSTAKALEARERGRR